MVVVPTVTAGAMVTPVVLASDPSTWSVPAATVVAPV